MSSLVKKESHQLGKNSTWTAQAQKKSHLGKGYKLTLPKRWVVKYGPAIKVAIATLQLAVAAGRIIGLPLPGLPQAKELIAQAEGDALRRDQRSCNGHVTVM